ncbi:MAG: diaminopimelate epimerase [Gammaproteobacteria bacterium]
MRKRPREIKFSKMHGCGNDFVVIDAVRQTLPEPFPAAQIAARRTGIGCDQILILQKPPRNARADFAYRIINADGGEVGQCGNGARCAHAFLRRAKLAAKTRLRLQTKTAAIQTEDAGKNGIRAYLAAPEFAPHKIPLSRKKEQLWYAAAAAEGGMSLPGRFAALSLGNPHAVFIAAAEDDLTAAGETLNTNRRLFAEGVNVGFCQKTKDGAAVRVYERGAGETPSCGSGAVAAAVVLMRGGALQSPVRITMPGGELLCGWSPGKAAWLQGKINFVFDGALRL